MNKIKIIIIASLLLFNPLNVQSQTTIIYRGDSTLIEKFMGYFMNNFNQQYYLNPYFDLNEKLPDGNYLVFSISKNDSIKLKVDDVISIRGQYKDSMRTGKFEYFTQCKIENRKNKYKNVLVHVFNYTNGLLDGYYKSCNCEYKTLEGFYKNGNRHGFFFSYDQNELIKVELYQEGLLLFHSNKPNITKNIEKL
ncbi:MAG: hypothetical protein ACKVQV_03300 [Bacteroidia bacterium]